MEPGIFSVSINSNISYKLPDECSAYKADVLINTEAFKALQEEHVFKTSNARQDKLYRVCKIRLIIL